MNYPTTQSSLLERVQQGDEILCDELCCCFSFIMLICIKTTWKILFLWYITPGVLDINTTKGNQKNLLKTTEKFLNWRIIVYLRAGFDHSKNAKHSTISTIRLLARCAVCIFGAFSRVDCQGDWRCLLWSYVGNASLLYSHFFDMIRNLKM